jgi:hypothetical protein
VVRVSPEEAERVTRFGAEMGIDTPIANGALRRDQGGCVFQQDDGLCGIHARYGFEAKPAICSQFPVVALATESGMRVGLDPGCYTHATTWQTAPMVREGSLAASRIEYDAHTAGEETAVLGLLSQPGMTIGRALGTMVGDPSGTLPMGFAARWAEHLRGVDFEEALADDTLGDAWRGAFEPLAAARKTWTTLPPWTLSEEAEAFGLDVVQRLVFLRLARRLGGPGGSAMMMLAGTVAMGWATGGEMASFGRGLAGWSRMLRSPMFMAYVLPDRQRLQWLIRG